MKKRGKYFLMAIAVLYVVSAPAQRLLDKNTYEAKNGMVFRVGDEISLGVGSDANRNFRYVSKQDLNDRISASYKDKKLKIKSIKERGDKKTALTTYLIAGSGLSLFWIDIEGAIMSNEVQIPEEFKTKNIIYAQQTQVFSIADELRKLKDLLDEGVLTEEEFEVLKKKLLAKSYD